MADAADDARLGAAFEVRRATTLALDDAGQLWVASPDDDRVFVLSTDTLEERFHFDVPDGPAGFAVAGERVLVSRARSPSLKVMGRRDPHAPGREVPRPCAWAGPVR